MSRVVVCTVSLAALEVVIHLPQKTLPLNFCMAAIEIPNILKIKQVKKARFPKNWQTTPISFSSRQMGDQWLEKQETAILCVSSVVILTIIIY